MKRLLALALVVAAVGRWSAAGGPAEGDWLVLSQVPAGRALFHFEPELRYPPGSRVVRVDLRSPAEPPLLLSRGMLAAGGASLSADAERLLFVGKQEEAGAYSVWVCDPDGRRRRRAVETATDCGGAAFLPDGRVVYSAVVGADGARQKWALHVAPGDGGPGRRITWSEGLEVDPAVLQDGRVVYSCWLPEGDGRPASGAFAVFTVHPDGSGASPLHGVHDGPSAKLQPRQAGSGDLRYLGGELGAAARSYGADRRFPGGNAYPAEDGPGTCWSLGPAARAEPWLADSAWQTTQALPLAPRPRPQGHLSRVDPDGDRGALLCIDARTGNGEGGRVRLREPGDRILGEVPLEADGSFYVQLPADRPIILDLLDDRGRVVHRGRAPFWVRPGETRCCVGCHEDPETAPPNRRPLAVLKDPVTVGLALTAETGQ